MSNLLRTYFCVFDLFLSSRSYVLPSPTSQQTRLCRCRLFVYYTRISEEGVTRRKGTGLEEVLAPHPADTALYSSPSISHSCSLYPFLLSFSPSQRRNHTQTLPEIIAFVWEECTREGGREGLHSLLPLCIKGDIRGTTGHFFFLFFFLSLLFSTKA